MKLTKSKECVLSPAGAPIALPPGTPEWVTPELVRETLEVFQPDANERLTEKDAVEMIVSVGNIYGALESVA